MILRPYQQAAVDAVYEHLRSKENNPCVVLPTGCHAKDHPILMYDGRIKKVQDIVVGDIIMGADSTPRHVLALARGHEAMARITPIKGEPFVVNMNHILSLVSTNEGKGDFPCYQKGGEITNITVREYLTKSKSWRHLRKLYRVPVEFGIPQNLPIPPHILGLLLGDGTMTNSIGLTSADEELGDEFSRYAESLGCSVRVSENDCDVPTYFASVAIGERNPLFEMQYQLGLRGHCAHNKFIPREYLTAARSDRLQLLAGLLDSDGFFDGHCLEITTQSQELAGDIVFLARSLGLMANCHEKYCACQTGAGGWYYRVHISGDLSPIPCRRKRHVFNIRRQKKNVLRTGFSVEELPEDDFFGFELDGDHLYVDGNFMVHHNTGKSIVIAKIVSDTVQNWNGRVLILAHVKELLEQNAGKIRALCPELKIGIFSAGLKSRDTSEQVIVAGIQSVYDKACDLGAFDIVIVDEAHLIAPDGDGMYRTFLKDMRIINPNVRVIGLTATPFRLKGGLICQPENLLNEVCYEVGLKEMIAQGYLSPLVSRAGRAEANLDGLHVRGGEFINDEVAAAMDTDELVSSACREIVDLTRDRKAVLIFTSSVEHCKHVAAKIEAFSGKECAMVTGETSPGERAEIIARFKGETVPADLFGTPKPPLKFLANVNVLCLSEDTEILTSKGFVGIDAMSFDHLIAAWKTDGSIEFTHPQNIIIRDRAQDESMVSVQKGQVPLYRVTDGHRMVIACGGGKKKIKTVSAKELIGKSHCIPTSGIATPLPLEPKQPILHNVAGRIRSNSYSYRKKGIPAPLAKHMADELIARQRQMKYKSPSELTVAECELIGFWVGDGTKASNRYSFCQSMRYPAIVNWIDRHIETIGLHAARNVKPRVGKMTNEAVVWTFAKGTGGDKQYVEGGIFPYLPYLEKGWNDLLFAFSQKQYESFLYGLWLADGLHTDDLTATHFHVSSDAYELYNCLQAIGAMRGFSTILHKAGTPRQQHHQQQWIFRWAKKKHLCYLKHSAILENDFRPERVWCVTSTTGYLICRRNGKTFVTGNCTGFDAPNTDCVVLLRPTNSAGLYVQTVGRGTRLSPATGKTNCLVLDYGGNVLRHGPVDMINVKEPGASKGGDAPAKKCPQCLALIHAGYAKCPECGYEFPPPEGNDKLTRNASNAGIISGQVDYTDYDVSGVYYCVHEKRYAEPGTPRTMRIDYNIGFNEFKSEWVCPEHTGYARGKFEKWWRERAALGCPIPTTAQEAVALASEGLLAEPESITVKTVAGERFERITGWRLKPRPIMREPGDDSREVGTEFDPPSNSPADLGVAQDDFDDSEIPF